MDVSDTVVSLLRHNSRLSSLQRKLGSFILSGSEYTLFRRKYVILYSYSQIVLLSLRFFEFYK